jgi:hypothetical protein
VNVWLALSYQRHVHYSAARAWFERLDDDVRACFCRLTQIGLLRLLTTEAVMGDDEVLSQVQAWRVYDRWIEDDRIVFVDEPPSLESRFRMLSAQPRAAPKDWADSYLSAFAETAGGRLVTFDRALGTKSGALLLQAL